MRPRPWSHHLFATLLRIATDFAKFDWQDPMRVNDLLTDEEVAIQETAHNFSQETLLPKVTEMSRKEGEQPVGSMCGPLIFIT